MRFSQHYQQRLKQGAQIDAATYENAYSLLHTEITERLVTALGSLSNEKVGIREAFKPLVHLGIFQFYNCLETAYVTHPGRNSPSPFQTLKALASTEFNSWPHHFISSLTPGTAFNRAKKLIQHETNNTALSFPQSSGTIQQPPTDIAFTLGMTFAERLSFNRQARAALIYLKGEQLDHFDWSQTLRIAWLDRLEKNLTLQPSFDSDMASLLACFAITAPTYLLEGLNHYYPKADQWANAAKVYVYGIEFQNKPDIALTLAIAKSRGKVMVGSQHGGGYGQTDDGWYQRTEYGLASHYITWGHKWSDTDIPLASPRLSRIRPRELIARWRYAMFPARSKEILVVPHSIFETPQHGHFSPSLSEQKAALTDSLNMLAPAVSRGFKLVLRYHPFDREDTIQSLIPDNLRHAVTLYRGKRGTLGTDGHRYHTTVFTNINATGIAECIQNNINFRVACKPEYYSILPPAKPPLKELNKQRIWLENTEQVEQWLKHQANTHSKNVVAVNHTYKQHFAQSSRYYVRDWVKALESLL